MGQVSRGKLALTGHSVLVGAVSAVLMPALGWLAAQLLISTFGWSGAGVLLTVVIGVVHIELFCVILLSPLVSRGRSI
jgi:hypothetical protein